MSTVSSRCARAHRGRGIWLFATRLDADSTGALSVYYRTKRRPRCARGNCVVSNQTCARTRTLLKLARALRASRRSETLSTANQLYMYTDAAPVLSASRRVTKTARSGVHDVHAGIVLALCCTANLEPNLCARTRTLLKLARAFTFACFTLICDAQQLYTDVTQMQLYTDAAPV
jgi:hypothetical protein